MKREHRVPLSRRALDILDTARTLDGGDSVLVFPSISGKRLHDMALSGLLKNQKVAAVPHGFRSSFRDWAAEETDHPREVIEAALAHVVQNKVEAAYARSDRRWDPDKVGAAGEEQGRGGLREVDCSNVADG